MTARAQPPGLVVIDVSAYQARVDWASVAASGVAGVYLRALEGVDEDTAFSAHLRGATEAGLLVGAYQFHRPRHHAAELVRRWRDIVPDGLTLPPVIDVEAADGATPDAVAFGVLDWLDAVGPTALVYCGAGFWNPHVTPGTALGRYRLWVASYTPAPLMPRDWKDWTLWQFTDAYACPGCPAPVDASVFRGTRDELAALAVDPSLGAVDVDPPEAS